MKIFIAALLLSGLSYAQPPILRVAGDSPVTISPTLMHYMGGAAAMVTSRSDVAIKWVTFEFRKAALVVTERVPVDIRPSDKEHVLVKMAGRATSTPGLAGGVLTIVAVEFADGTSWKSR
jgi:hypothetical protein